MATLLGSRHNILRTFGHPVATCSVSRCWLKFENGQIFMMLYSFAQVHATMLRRDMRFNSICNTQHFATHRNRVAKRANGRAGFLRFWLIHLHFRVSTVISIFSCLVLCHNYSFKIFLGDQSLRSVGEGPEFGGDPPLQASDQ